MRRVVHNGCPVIILRIIADARSITTEKAAVICEVRLIWSPIRIVVMPPVALMACNMGSFSFHVCESGITETTV